MIENRLDTVPTVADSLADILAKPKFFKTAKSGLKN
jgi:hypothetical protein